MRTIIIDDRKDRKKQYLDDNSIEKLSSLCSVYESLTSFQELDDYYLLAIHESLLKEHNDYNKLIDYVKQKQKLLILFSGGITQNTILNSGKLLKINSADFYSNILHFFNNEIQEETEYALLKFLYGPDWKLPLLLQYKNLIWIYGDDIDYIEDDHDASIEKNIRRIFGYIEPIPIEWINKELEIIIK